MHCMMYSYLLHGSLLGCGSNSFIFPLFQTTTTNVTTKLVVLFWKCLLLVVGESFPCKIVKTNISLHIHLNYSSVIILLNDEIPFDERNPSMRMSPQCIEIERNASKVR
jgi:hypothetical protein